MHKQPIKFRFISGAKHSSLKTLSVTLQIILKHVRVHFENLCNFIFERPGVIMFWAVDNGFTVVKDILNVVPNSVTRIFSADFTSLFKIYHIVLLNQACMDYRRFVKKPKLCTH